MYKIDARTLDTALSGQCIYEHTVTKQKHSDVTEISYLTLGPK